MNSRQKTIILADYNNLDELRSSIDNKFHYFYKIYNPFNEKYYYGIHSTVDIYDGYAGSGTILKSVYKKYGKNNCIKYIEKFFDDRKSLLEYEEMIVSDSLLEDKNCYNIIKGGVGNCNFLGTPILEEAKYVSSENYLHNKFTHPTKGKIHINNGIKNKLVSPQLLEEYLSNGWKKGELQSSTKGKIVINKTGMSDRFIHADELEEYLSNGWNLGGKSRNFGLKSYAKNLIWINNGDSQKRINKNELEEYLSNGWKKGTCQSKTKGYIRITDGKQNKNIHPDNKNELEEYLSNGWKKGSTSPTNKGKIWMSKDEKSIQINKNELEEYLSNGWKKGRSNINNKPNLNKIAVNKNSEVIMINKNELEEYLSNGWKKGNPLINNSHNKGKICVVKNGMIKKINSGELEEYLSNGWKKGMGNSPMKGRIRINNGCVEKMVSEDDYINIYMNKGYIKGLLYPRKKYVG